MDGLTDEPSILDGDSGDPPKKSPTYAETFEELCPKYMLMGMTYDEYWTRPTRVHRAYRAMWKERCQREEWARWRQGMYTYATLMRMAPLLRASFGKGVVKAEEYLDEPIPLTEQEARERKERKAREAFRRNLARMTAVSDRELKRRAEEKQRQEVSDNA